MGKNQNTWSHSTKIIFGEIKIIFHPSEASRVFSPELSFFDRKRQRHWQRITCRQGNMKMYSPKSIIFPEGNTRGEYDTRGWIHFHISWTRMLWMFYYTVWNQEMAVCSVYILVNWTKLRSPYIWLTNIKCHIFRKKPTYWDWGIFWIRFDAWNKYRWTITQTSWIIIYIIWFN
jgi:hypothetical protein